MHLDKHKSFFYVFSVVFNAALGTFFFGYMIGVFNPTQTCVEIVNGWNESEKKVYDGVVTALMPVGAIIGAFIGGILGSKIGRRWTFILADIIGIVGCVIWIFSGFPLFLGRFIGGISVGINSAVVPLYINEISPISVSGVMGSMTQLMVNVGILISFLLGLNLSDKKTIQENPDGQFWWRFMFAFPIITQVIRTFLLLTVFNFDTVPYLVSKGRDEEAKTVLKKFYYEDSYEEIYDQVKSKMSNSKDVSFGDLFSKKYRGRLSMGILLSGIQQFSGVNAVIFYSTKIFTGDSGNDDEVDPFDEKMAKIFTILIGLILIFSSWLSGKFIDKFGRKSILLMGEMLCILTLFFLTLFGYIDLKEPSKYIILVYMFSFGISLGPIVWLYLPEILPEKGVSLAALANWVFCGIIGLCFPMVKETINIQGTFLIFLCCCCAGLLYMMFFVKETKGKSAEEIEAMFNGKVALAIDDKRLLSGNTDDASYVGGKSKY